MDDLVAARRQDAGHRLQLAPAPPACATPASATTSRSSRSSCPPSAGPPPPPATAGSASSARRPPSPAAPTTTPSPPPRTSASPARPARGSSTSSSAASPAAGSCSAWRSPTSSRCSPPASTPLVLGCTHYPLLTGVHLAACMGDEVTLVSSAEETAKDVYRVLTRADLLRDEDAPAAAAPLPRHRRPRAVRPAGPALPRPRGRPGAAGGGGARDSPSSAAPGRCPAGTGLSRRAGCTCLRAACSEKCCRRTCLGRRRASSVSSAEPAAVRRSRRPSMQAVWISIWRTRADWWCSRWLAARPLGIDVESYDKKVPLEVARRYFSPMRPMRSMRCPADARPRRFLQAVDAQGGVPEGDRQLDLRRARAA